MTQADTTDSPGPGSHPGPGPADTPTPTRERSWRHDGAIAGAGFAVEAVLFGVLYTFGVVLDPIRDDLGASRSVVALMPAISAFLLFFVGPFTGWLADRFGTHRTVAAGGVILAAGLALASVAPSLWLVVLAYGVLGGLAASLAYVPVVAHIAALPSRRAPALVGIVVAGVGIGTAVASPLMEWSVRTNGWRATYRGYAVLALVVLGLGSLVFGRQPRHGGPVARSMLATLRPVAASAGFTRLYLALLLVCPAIYVGLIFLPGYITDEGLSASRAAFAASLLGIFSAAGRVLLSALGRRLGSGVLFRLSLGFLAASLGLWLVAGGSYPALLVYAALAGTGYGGTIGLAPTVAAQRFGPTGLGSILGGLYTSLGAAALLTGPAAGAVIDRWGYRPAFVAIGLMAVVATVLVPSAAPAAAPSVPVAPTAVGTARPTTR